PVMLSMPIMPSSRPRQAINNVRISEDDDIYARKISPSTRRAVYSGGPNRIASVASGGATTVSISTPNEPPIQEPTAAMQSAAPARPFLAMAYPSIQVITEDASPGMRIKIEVVEPPYCEP